MGAVELKARGRDQKWRWLGFVTAIWVQAIAGNNYTFSNYSVALKAIMNLNQLQLNNLSVAKDVGKAFGLVAGFASDYLPAWIILLIGSLEGAVGYGAQWLVVSQRIRPLPYWQMCIFLCMGGNSTTWMNTAVLLTCMRNFPRNRGPVSGILKGYIGLSTAIFTDLCSALFASDPSYFLLMLVLIPGLVCITSMVFLRPVPPAADEREEKQDSKNFRVFNVVAVVLAVYLLCFDMTGEHGIVLSRVFAGILLCLLAAPLVVPLRICVDECKAAGLPWPFTRARRRLDIENQAEEPLLHSENGITTSAHGHEISAAEDASVVEAKGKEAASTNINEEETKITNRKPRIGEDHTIWQALQKFDFWLLFVGFLCGVGTGMAVMNNLGQIGLAMGYVEVSMFVSLTSIWGFFGRIGAGSMSEHFMRRGGVPRPVWMAASQILMFVGYILLAIGMPGSLYIGSIVVGICYGVRLSISVPTASELFGLKYYGLIYNFLILNLPLGSFLFSGLLAGILYDIEAAKGGQKFNATRGALARILSRGNSDLESINTCVGAHCYRMVFIVMSGVCLMGCGLDVLLCFRTKRLYANMHKSNKRNAGNR